MKYSSEAVCEIIPTIQGEIKVGEPVIMVRLNGCNLHCSWCDTKYSWIKNKIKTPKLVDDDIEAILEIHTQFPNIETLMITGGEPLLYTDQDKFFELLLIEGFKFIQIETNGTKLINNDNFNPNNFRYYTTLNISPKLNPNYYNLESDYDNLINTIKDYIPYWQQFPFMINMNLKFVYYDEIKEDILKFINSFENKEFGLKNIYIMSQTTSIENFANEQAYINQIKLKDINTIKFCMEHGFNFTPRYHTFLFNNNRLEMVNS